jgi:hypothetical protein
MNTKKHSRFRSWHFFPYQASFSSRSISFVPILLRTLACPEQQRRVHSSAAISFLLILFRTLLQPTKRYLPSFQSNPNSCCKTAGVGYPRAMPPLGFRALKTVSPLSTHSSPTRPSNSFALIFFPKTPGGHPLAPPTVVSICRATPSATSFSSIASAQFPSSTGWGGHTHASGISARISIQRTYSPGSAKNVIPKELSCTRTQPASTLPVVVNSLSRVCRSSFFSVSSVHSVLRNTRSFKQPAPEHHAPLRFHPLRISGNSASLRYLSSFFSFHGTRITEIRGVTLRAR